MILFPKTIWGTLYGKTKVRDWSIGIYAEICMNMIFLFKRNRKKMESVSHEDIATYAASPKNYPSLISQCYPAQSETPCPMQRYLYSVKCYQNSALVLFARFLYCPRLLCSLSIFHYFVLKCLLPQ